MKRSQQGFSATEKGKKRTKKSPERKHMVIDMKATVSIWARRPENNYNALDQNGRVIEEPQPTALLTIQQPGKFFLSL